MRKLTERIDGWLTTIAMGAVATIMLTTSADAILRYVIRRPIPYAPEVISDYVMVALIWLGIGYTYRMAAHVRVALVVQRLDGLAKLLSGYFAQLFSLGITVLLFYATIRQTVLVYTRGHLSDSLLAYPMWPAYGLIPLGLLFMGLLMIMDLPRVHTGQSALLRDDDHFE